MSAEIAHFTITVSTTKASVIDVSGELFVCFESSARFEMQFDDRPKFPCLGGFTLRLPDGFKRITLFNLSSTDALTVDFYAGNTFVSFEYLRTRPTRSKAQDGTLLNGESADLHGIDSGQRRKSVMVSNRHATAELLLTDQAGGAGNIMAAIPAKTICPPIETDALVSIFNNSGGSIQYASVELFYT